MCRHTGGYGILDEGEVNVLKFRTIFSFCSKINEPRHVIFNNVAF